MHTSLTRLMLLVAFISTQITFVALRSADGSGSGEFAETSVRCVKLGRQWQEPHGISPGYCK